jgi:hypothetical protein
VVPSYLGGRGGGGPSDDKQDKSINIKITTKSQAIINEKTKRKRGDLKKARKSYNTLKKATIKAIRKGKSEHYKRESDKIKALPIKQRKAARDKLRKTLKAREQKLIGQLPSSTKMKLHDLNKVTQLATKLRW